MPLRIDGFPKSRKTGAGIVIDHVRGLVIVSRSIVPFDLGDLTVTVADSVVIPAKVVMCHPTHNITLISYNPAHLTPETNIQTANFDFSNGDIVQGDKLTLVAFNHNSRPCCVDATVTDVASVTIPHSGVPRFRAINIDAVSLDTPLAQQVQNSIYKGPVFYKKIINSISFFISTTLVLIRCSH